MSISLGIHMRGGDNPATSRTLPGDGTYVETLRFGENIVVYVDSEKNAEQLLDAVAGIVARFRTHRVTVEATIAKDAQELEGCEQGGNHIPETNVHGDAWCSRCGERLLLVGAAGGPAALEVTP